MMGGDCRCSSDGRPAGVGLANGAGEVEVRQSIVSQVRVENKIMSNPSMFQNWLGATQSFSSPEEAKSFCLDTIEEEISILEKELPVAHQCIIYCHSDFQYSNITID